MPRRTTTRSRSRPPPGARRSSRTATCRGWRRRIAPGTHWPGVVPAVGVTSANPIPGRESRVCPRSCPLPPCHPQIEARRFDVGHGTKVSAWWPEPGTPTRSCPFGYPPDDPEPVQAQDLPDSPIVVAEVLHRDGDLRIVADVLDLARQFRTAIQVGAEGDVIVADQLDAVVDHPGELVHVHPVFVGDG